MKGITLFLLGICLWPTLSNAGEWVFSSPQQVVPTIIDGRVYHHLESSGRRSIAVAGKTVAVTWEDDHDGTPRIYLAYRRDNDAEFTDALRVSGEGEGYEPSIIGLSGNRFVLAWQESEQVLVRAAGPNGLGPVVKLSSANGGQPSLAQLRDEAIIVWSERSGKYGHIRMAQLDINDTLQVNIKDSCAADIASAADEQLYPAVATISNELVVAWEDRRPGHTVIMASQGGPCKLSSPVRISEKIEQRSVVFGKGHGVSRVTLASHGENRVLAAWADKRDFREGYDIYAADYQHGKGFGSNMRVQDDFGGVARQWHPTAAGHSDGRLIVAWTDEREGNSDIMFSVYANGEWSEDLPMAAAAGPSEQAHPSIIFDNAGMLHVAWIQREGRNGPTQLMYMVGHLSKE